MSVPSARWMGTRQCANRTGWNRLGARIKQEAGHYWKGTKLFVQETGHSMKIAGKMARGIPLRRKEGLQLKRTKSDLFKLIPFSVFVIVPFAEFLLPFYLKLFPDMLPSTFESFPDPRREQLERARTKHALRLASGQWLGPALDVYSIDKQHLRTLCSYLNIWSCWSKKVMAYRLRKRMAQIANDDRLIHAEGIGSLDDCEIYDACVFRGIRTVGHDAADLKQCLHHWIESRIRDSVGPLSLVVSHILDHKKSCKVQMNESEKLGFAEGMS